MKQESKNYEQIRKRKAMMKKSEGEWIDKKNLKEKQQNFGQKIKKCQKKPRSSVRNEGRETGKSKQNIVKKKMKKINVANQGNIKCSEKSDSAEFPKMSSKTCVTSSPEVFVPWAKHVDQRHKFELDCWRNWSIFLQNLGQ